MKIKQSRQFLSTNLKFRYKEQQLLLQICDVATEPTNESPKYQILSKKTFNCIHTEKKTCSSRDSYLRPLQRE